jgi:hypothetical protein
MNNTHDNGDERPGRTNGLYVGFYSISRDSADTNTGITDSYRPGDAAAASTQRTPPSFTRTNALVGNLAISTFRAIHSPWEPVFSADPEPFASPQLLPVASDRLAQPATNSTRQHIVLDLT